MYPSTLTQSPLSPFSCITNRSLNLRNTCNLHNCSDPRHINTTLWVMLCYSHISTSASVAQRLTIHLRPHIIITVIIQLTCTTRPAGFGYNIFPMNRLGNALAQQAQLAQEPNLRAHQQPQQPHPFYEFMQDPLPRARHAQLDANHVNQRLEELRNRQQQQAQLAMQRRLRLMNLQQENLARQRELLLQDDDGAAMRNPRAVRDHLEEAMRAQPRPRHG
jgi:hypothetical protein